MRKTVFSRRTYTYKGGMFLFCFAVVVYIVGFASPFWSVVSVSEEGQTKSAQEGIWELCTQTSGFGVSSTSCDTFGSPSQLAGWFHVVRSMEGVSVSLLLIACIFAFITNCCMTVPTLRTRVQEFLAFLGGVVGLVGVIVYGIMRQDNSIYDTSIVSDAPDLLLTSQYTLDWALYLAGFGSALSIVTSIIIGVGNKRLVRPGPEGVVDMTVLQTVNGGAFTAGQVNYMYEGPQPSYEYDFPGNRPPQVNISPVQNDYQLSEAPTQAGYPPTQAVFPMTQAVYPRTQAGYPVTQAGYPMTKAGYQMTQAAYPPTQAGYENPQKI